MNAKVQITGRKITSISVKQLIVAPDNPRQTPATQAEDDELKRSIESIGVVMPLIAKAVKKNQFAVYAGGRRLKQTNALIKEKKQPADIKLPVIVVDSSASATEIAMIETTLRAEMHAIDQYEAYAKMHDVDGLTVAEIALHSGRTEHSVRKVLALGGAHPQLRKLCREGKLKVESLQAYAITDDKKKQLEAYKALEKQGTWDANDPDEIRRLLTTNTYTDRDKIVKCIGVDNYRARDGKVTTDLFQGQSILHDTKLVEQMFQEQLDAETSRLTTEGWKWVETDLQYSDYNNPCTRQKPTIAESKDSDKQLKAIEAQRKKLLQEKRDLPTWEDDITSEQEEAADKRAEEIDQLLEGLADQERAIKASAQTFTPKQKSAGGCIITLDSNGRIRTIQGLIKPEDQKEKKQPKKSAAKGGKGATTDAPESAALSQAVKDDLRKYHLSAAKAELLYTPGIMYNLMQFSICWEVFTSDHEFGSELPEHLLDTDGCPLNIQLHNTYSDSSLNDIDESRMHQEIAEYRAKLNLSWIKRNAGESWPAFLELSSDDVMKLVGYCATLTLNSKLFGGNREEDEGQDVIDLVLQQTNARLAKHWRPNAGNYFSRVPRPTLEAAGKVIDGNPDFPKNQTGIKTKKQLVEFLEHRMTGTNKPSNNDCWMPEGFLYHTLGEEKMP